MNIKKYKLGDLRKMSIDEWIAEAPFYIYDSRRSENDDLLCKIVKIEPKDLNGSTSKTSATNSIKLADMLDSGSKQIINGTKNGCTEYRLYVTKP